MQHIDESTLRRSLDDEAVFGQIAAHLQECDACRATRNAFAENAAFAQRALDLAMPAHAPQFSIEQNAVVRPRWLNGALAGALAASFVLAMIFTPLGGIAAQFLTIFEPQHFAPIRVSTTDEEQLRLLPALSAFGTIRTSGVAHPRLVEPTQAKSLLGFAPQRLDIERIGNRAHQSLFFVPGQSVRFTFSARKAHQYELRNQHQLPPMPPGLDHTTVHTTIGPWIAQAWSTGPIDLKTVDREGPPDVIVFMQSKAPRVLSSGASLTTMMTYLLALPNIPPDVAAQLRMITNPSQTLPIPIPITSANARTVSIGGVQGLAFGDETGLGSAVVWQANGREYALFGPLKLNEAIALAGRVR